MTGAQKKIDEYEIIGALNPCKQIKQVKNPWKCGRMTELKSFITVRENVHVKKLP